MPSTHDNHPSTVGIAQPDRPWRRQAGRCSWTPSSGWLHFLAFVSVWLALGLARPAWAADDFVVKRAFLADPQGDLTIEQVAQRQDFKPVGGPLSLGFFPGAVWLRVEVAPTPFEQLALLVQPAMLDDVRLYSPRPVTQQGVAQRQQVGFFRLPLRSEDGPEPKDPWLLQRSGDRVALADKAVKTINPAFMVASDPERPTVHYVRMQTTSVSLLHVRALSPSGLMAFDTLIHSVVSAYVGLIGILAVFAFVCWYITRDPIWGLDSAFQGVTLAFTLSIMGLGGRYWFADAPLVADLVTSTLALAHLAMASWFFWQLFKVYGSPGWTSWVYRGTLLLFPVMLGLLVMGEVRTAISINSNLILLQTLYGLVAIWFVPVQDRLQRWLLRSIYVGLVLYVLYFILPLLGLAKPTQFNLYPALGANLFTGLLMQAVLWRRTHLQLRERAALRLRLAESEQQAQFEATRRAEASTFLGMLVHEIKNPPASIALASQSLARSTPEQAEQQARQLQHIQNAVQGIDTVLERCVDTDRFEQGALTVHRQHHHVPQLLADWVSTEPEAARIQLAVPDTPDPAATELTAWVDAPLLCLMVRNLLSNALKYSPPGTPVVLRLETAEASGRPGLRISVRNAPGKAGVPDPQRVFDKYYRAPSAQRITGTGLGLYWVQGVAQLLGGEVAYRLETAGDLPVVFELWLPLDAAPLGTSPSGARVGAPGNGPAGALAEGAVPPTRDTAAASPNARVAGGPA